MPITGGKVVYSRTIQVAQFEPKRAEVEISFEVKDGEVFDQVLSEAMDIARQQTIFLVNQRDRR